jgi:hypothetical protein
MNKLFKTLIFSTAIISLVGCKKYLDINSDPASPQEPDLASLLSPVLATSITGSSNVGTAGTYFDYRFVGQYIQNFTTNTTAGENYDAHGGNGGGAAAAASWRAFYFNQNSGLRIIIEKGTNDQNWDYVGVAHAVRAWGFQQVTDYFGDVPFYDAGKTQQAGQNATYRYDKQEVIYKGIDSLCRKAVEFLLRTDGNQTTSTLSRGDIVYRGDKTKWIRFVYGLMARNFQRISNKSTYSADSVIKYVDLSLVSGADDYTITYSGSRNDDTYAGGPARDNYGTRRQSRFITQLLDGTVLAGSAAISANRDPRISRMLNVSFDTTTLNAINYPVANGGYRFAAMVATGLPDPEATGAGLMLGSPQFRRRVSTLFGDSLVNNTAVGIFNARAGKYVFQNTIAVPLMAYHELQFVKAEALYRKGSIALAHAAYLNAINAHFDFVNRYTSTAPGIATITPAQRAAYMASANVKQTPGVLTLTDIMLQKYIGDWAWNILESWCDVRRYHYFDQDPITNDQVYKSFAIPFFSTNNQGPKPAYRFYPLNFSEFDWNINEVRRVGGLNIDYHTYEMWFSQP